MRIINKRNEALKRIGFSPISLALVILALVLPAIPPFNQEYLIRWLISATLLAAQSIAFDFTAGFINVVNFGFAAFVGLGAYTSALMVIHYNLSPWIGMILGGISSAILGLFTGMLSLRLRGIYAAILTWYIALAMVGLTRNFVDLTRGPLGLNVPYLFNTASNVPYYYVVLGMLLLTYIVLRLITSSNIGLAFKVIGQNIDAARASGVDPTKYRVLNFMVSCAFAGWLGGFYAHYIGILTPQVMATMRTVEVLAITYIGGRGSIWGGALIAFPFTMLIEWFRSRFSDLPGGHLILYGLLLIVVMLFYPKGFAELCRYVISALYKGMSIFQIVIQKQKVSSQKK